MKIDKTLAEDYYNNINKLGYLSYYSQDLSGDYSKDKTIWIKIYTTLARKKRYEEFKNRKQIGKN